MDMKIVISIVSLAVWVAVAILIGAAWLSHRKRVPQYHLRRAITMKDEEYLESFAAGPTNMLWRGVEEMMIRLEEELLSLGQDPSTLPHIKLDGFAKVGVLRELRAQMFSNYAQVAHKRAKEQQEE